MATQLLERETGETTMPQLENSQDNFSDSEKTDITIYKTRNYHKFRFDPANRPVDMVRAQRLARKIMRNNLLAEFPISVTPDGVITDGQHRVVAAEICQVDFFYRITAGLTMENAANAASEQEKWTVANRLHYWTVRGDPDYIALDRFWREYPWLTISAVTRLCSTHSYQSEVFKEGGYECDNLPFARQVAEMAIDFKPYFDWWSHITFISALRQLVNNEKYDHRRMMQKISYQSTKLRRCSTAGQYLEILTEIYNYNTAKNNRVYFRSR